MNGWVPFAHRNRKPAGLDVLRGGRSGSHRRRKPIPSSGKKSMNTVPDRLPFAASAARLATRTVALCLAIISPLTHRPRPVPVVSLVVKNGSKIRRRVACGHAAAVVRNEQPNPGGAVHPRTGSPDRQPQMPSLGHGVDGIADQVGEDLAQLPGKAVKIDIRPALARNLDLQRLQPPRIHRQNRIQQLRQYWRPRARSIGGKSAGSAASSRRRGRFPAAPDRHSRSPPHPAKAGAAAGTEDW